MKFSRFRALLEISASRGLLLLLFFVVVVEGLMRFAAQFRTGEREFDQQKKEKLLGVVERWSRC
jgi:hypothetical protein